LDIALPGRADQLPSPEGGIGLLEEVLDRDIYKKPREVVGLTAFPEVREKVGPRFAQDLWDVIQYDTGSDAWAEYLKRKVKYVQLALKPGVETEYQTELCIVTALPKPELAAITALAWHWQSTEIPGDGTVYKSGHYNAKSGTKQVIAAVAPRMGMTAAGVLATKMIYNFRPRYIATVGIIAGIRGSCALGDILAADPVWDWGSGKRSREGDSGEFLAAPHQVSLHSSLRGKLVAMSQEAATLDDIRRRWQARPPQTALSMYVGPVASGSAVLADQKMVELIKQQHRKIIGIDMEIYGVLAAADEAPIPIPRAFALKSVCDFADDEKSDDHQEYAAYTSAEALKIFVENYLD
jgi:nucleoside phosphorylase